MTNNIDKVKRFRSCFICEVEICDDYIMLEDSVHMQYIIHKNDAVAVESFASWFKNVYLKCIPQTLTIIDYSILSKNDDESYYKVNKLITNVDKNQN